MLIHLYDRIQLLSSQVVIKILLAQVIEDTIRTGVLVDFDRRFEQDGILGAVGADRD